MNKDGKSFQMIVDSAKKLIQQYGLAKTSMEDIAKASGKGKSTLYHYFKSKEEVFEEVIRQEMDDFFKAVKEAVDKEKDVKAKLKTYIVTKIGTLRSKVNLYRFAIESDASMVNSQFVVLKERYDGKEKKLIASILNLGIESRLFSATHKSDIPMLAEILVSCARGIEMDVILKNRYGSLANRIDRLVSIVVKGLG